MRLPVSVEHRVGALTDPERIRWDVAGLGRSRKDRQNADSEAARRILRGLGQLYREMPLEQLELTAALHAQERRERGGDPPLGLVGEALDVLAKRYYAFEDDYPVPHREFLEEFQGVKLRLVGEQLACWAVARELRKQGPGAMGTRGTWPRLDWDAGSHLGRSGARARVEEGLVECHVHLGGVVDSLELWREILDDEISVARLRSAVDGTAWAGNPSLSDRIRYRIEQAGILRLLLALEVERVMRPPGQPDDPSPLQNHLFDALVREVALERRFDSVTALTATGGGLRRATPLRALRSQLGLGAMFQTSGLLEERDLLVRAFAVASRLTARRPARWFGPLLTVYLVAQNLFHASVTQSLSRVGLGTFLEWYDAPTRNLATGHDHEHKVRTLATISDALRIRVEGRIIPSPQRVRAWALAFEDLAQRTVGRAASDAPALHGVRFRTATSVAASVPRLGHDFGLVCHFIKRRDSRSSSVDAPLPPFLRVSRLRFADLRTDVRRQARELELARATNQVVERAVLGIDAARGETDTPPEVFGPAFRFLRRALPQRNSLPPGGARQPGAPPLRATFHVGESFHHPLTGLRAVHEAVRFLRLGPGDRLGHGMVLGVDPEKWIERSGPPPLMRREELLDTIVWVLHFAAEAGVPAAFAEKARTWADAQAVELYGALALCPAKAPYVLLGLAWSMRWMDPEELRAVLRLHHVATSGPCAHAPQAVSGSRPPRSASATCASHRSSHLRRCPAVVDPTLTPFRRAWRLASVDLEAAVDSPFGACAARPLMAYHFDTAYWRRATEVVAFPRELSGWSQAFVAMRNWVLEEIRRLELTIEVCPTSNAVIGGFGGLEHHPIFQLDGPEPFSRARPGRVVVCTDDPGIFSTNLRNEYALLANAAHRRAPDADIPAWLGRLTAQARESTFLRPSREDGPPLNARDSPNVGEDLVARIRRNVAETENERSRDVWRAGTWVNRVGKGPHGIVSAGARPPRPRRTRAPGGA